MKEKTTEQKLSLNKNGCSNGLPTSAFSVWSLVTTVDEAELFSGTGGWGGVASIAAGVLGSAFLDSLDSNLIFDCPGRLLPGFDFWLFDLAESEKKTNPLNMLTKGSRMQNCSRPQNLISIHLDESN